MKVYVFKILLLYIHLSYNIWPSTQENLYLGCLINKDADQPVHLRRLISTFIIHFSKSIISKFAAKEISFF